MLDISGLLDNWSWAGDPSTEVPHWLKTIAVPVLLLCAGTGMVLCFWQRPEEVTSVLVAYCLALLCDLRFLRHPTAIIAYAHTLLLALAMVALSHAFGVPLREVVALAPVTAAIGAPILTRLWGATLWSWDVREYVRKKQEDIRAALAGESPDWLMRVLAHDAKSAEAELVGQHAVRRVVLSESLIEQLGRTPNGSHYLVQAPDFQEQRRTDEYRQAERVLELRGWRRLSRLGKDARATDPALFDSDLRAGVVLMLIHNALVAGAVMALL